MRTSLPFAACESILLAALVAGCRSTPLPAATADVPSLSRELTREPLTLGPGDVLHVGVLAHPELSTPVGNPGGTRIDDQGLLSLPLVGEVEVGDKSLAEARAAIAAAYAQYVRDAHVDVSVLQYAARRYYLYGEVQRPGAYVIDRPLDVYQALAIGGGFTPHARREQVVLLRGRPDSLEVAVIDGETPNARGMLAVRPDDLLFVRRSGAGKFSEEVLPILTGISSSLSSVAALILIDDRVH